MKAPVKLPDKNEFPILVKTITQIVCDNRIGARISF